MEQHRALRATDRSALVEDELAADGALQRRAAQHGQQLLLERAME
jgi:hypothetical protein